MTELLFRKTDGTYYRVYANNPSKTIENFQNTGKYKLVKGKPLDLPNNIQVLGEGDYWK